MSEAPQGHHASAAHHPTHLSALQLIEAIRKASHGEPLEKITNSRPPCVIL